jgi:hypothetical protein
MHELLSLVVQSVRAAVRRRNDLILENLLLRHQLQVALRPTAFSGSSSGGFARTGAVTFYMSDRKR